VRALALLAATVLLLVGFASSGDEAKRRAQVRVTMTPETCRAAPIELEVGETLFTVVNRTRRPRTFTISGRRTPYLRPGTTGRLRVSLTRTGVYRFFCVSQGPRSRVRTGVVAVRPTPAPPPSSP
jgi:hypothetical protein